MDLFSFAALRMAMPSEMDNSFCTIFRMFKVAFPEMRMKGITSPKVWCRFPCVSTTKQGGICKGYQRWERGKEV